MADGIERKITLGIGIDVNTEKVKTADAMLSSFVKKYDDTILKVDTNDFNKAAREIKSLEDEINRVKKQSPKMLPALDPNIKQVENFKAKYKDAFAIFTDGSIAKGIDNIFDKIDNGGAVSIIDLGSRMEYLKRQATEVIKEIKSVGDLTKFWDGTLDYRSGNMDSSGIQKRIDLINKLIECQKELQMFSPTKLESKDFESGHNIRFLESMANELNQSLAKLKNFNLQTTEQLNRREELISKIHDTSNWQDNKGSGFEEYLKSDKGDFEWYIANLKDCVTERKQLLKDFNNSEDELFSTDGNEWRNILRDQIDEQEQYIKMAQEVREASSKTNNVPINTDFTEAIQALNEIRDAIREVKEAFEPLTTALSTEGTAFQQMATQGSASLDTLAAKLKEVRELVDQLNQKDFKVTQNVFQGKSGGANEVLSTYKAEAKSLLKIINNISNTVLGTFGNTGLKTLFPENIVKELISFASISDQLGKDINGAKGVAEIKSIYASLEEYAKIIYKMGEITNQKFPGFIDLSKLQNAKSVLDIEGMISAGTSNAKNESTSNITDKMLGEIKTARDQIDAELQAIRQRIESTFDLSTIEPNYQNVQFITDTIYQYFKDLEAKIKALDFNISIPEIKSNVDSSTSFLGNEASEFNNITSEANSAADAKNKFTAANKQAGPSAEESANSFKKEEQYLENVGQAADVTCDKIKSVSDANGNLLHTTQTSSNVGKKSINTIIDSYSYDEDGNPQLQTTTFIQDFKKRIDEAKKETTKIKTAQTNLKKFLSQFNSKTAGMGQYLTGYQALSGFNINSIDDIDKAIQMMMNLDSEYNKLSQNFRKGTKSMNPFANAINSIDEMENKIKQAQAAFSSLNTQPDELKTKISDLSPLFDKLQSAIIKDADGNITSVDIYKLAEAYGALNAAIKQVNSGISTQRKLDIADRAKNKENNVQLQKELNTLYQKRQGILNNIAKYTDKSQNLKTERGRSSAQEALDIEKERLAAINEEIYAYGDLVNQKKIDLQDTKLAEKIRTKNFDSYIKTEDITETEKANDLLNQRSEVIGNIIRLEKQLGKTTSSQDNEAVQKVLDNEKEKYKVLTDQLSVYKEQSIQQQVNAQDEKLISGVKNNNMQQFINDAAKAGKSQFKEISDLYSIYLNAQKNIRKMDLDFSGKDYTDRRANAENVALQAREKLLALGVDINDIDASDVLTIEQKTKLLEKEASQREELNKLMSEASDKERNAANAQAMKPIDATFKQLTNAFGGDIDKYVSNVFGNMTLGDNFKNQVTEYKTALKDVISAYDSLSKSPFDEKFKAQFDEAAQRAKNLGAKIENVAKSTQNFEKYGTAFDSFKSIDNIDDVEKLKSSMLELANSVTNNKFKFEDFDSTNKVLTGTFTNQAGEIEKLTVAYNDAAEAAQAFHKNTNQKAPTLFGQLKGLVTDGAKRIISLYLDITDLIRYVSKGVQAVREIDLAMTELKKVTDETDESYTKFLKNASKTASTIGATLKDFTTVTSDFARLGYSMEESADLAKVALVYENVGDGFSSVSEASESIISTMKAFGIEATDTMEIVDKFNEVGNNFAITSKGIGDALQRSASSLYEAGNTLDESIGLITGMNSVVQDPEMVGTALKTLTMRLRGAKTELEDAGLDADNMASSTSKLREQLLALTGVDIMQDANTFKSTTQILREMSAVWEDLSDIDAAAALELMGGKRQANILASALKNWQTVEDAISTSLGSEGSALEENQKYLDSIQGRIDIFNNAIQTMWSNLISSDFIKGVVDVGTTLVEIFDSATGKVLAFVAALHLISKFKFGRKDGILDVVKSIGGLFSNFKTGFAAKGGGLSGIFGGLASVGFGNVFTIALALLPAIIALVNKLKNRSAELKQEVQQINSAYKEQKDTIEDNLKQLTTSSDTKKYKSLQAEFNHLAIGVDEQGNNVSLTADEYERYRDICETIVGIQPGLAAGYDSATAAINNNASALSNLIEIQKKEERQAAEKYVSNDNLKKIAIDAINDYNDAQDILDDIFNDGTGYAIWDAAYQAYGEENDLSEHFGDNRVADNVVREILRSINPFITDDEVSEQLKDYYYKNGNFNEQKWYQENMDLLEENIDSFPSELADRISEWTSGNTALKNAKQGMIDALLEVPKSLEKYDNFTTSEKSFMTDWIKNSGVFEIDENTSAYTVLTWKEQIREMASALDADSLTTEIEGNQISASDILDSIYNLDPSTLNWEKYKSEMSGLIDHFWNAIGADDNQFGLKKDSLSKMFGFDEENLQEQYGFMFTRLSRILGEDSAEFKKWKAYIEGLDAVQIKRLIEVDWNVVDKNNLESTINGALVDDFTVKNFSHYSDSIDSIKSNISTLQDALESLESGSFTYSDFIELAQQFPELAEGVDTSSDAFDGLAINLQKAIKAAPDDLVNELKDLRKQLVETGKDTTAIDQLIDSIENLPTDAVDSLASKFGTLSDKISEANTAQGKLSAAMSEDPDANYKNTSEALQKMKELYDSGVVGSESQVWSIYESLTGKSYDYTKSLEDNKKALKDWIDTYDSWYLSTDNEEYSTAGLENFLNDVEAIVTKAKANGEEWAKDITWTYENGVAEIDFANTDWDTIADYVGVTSEMFADLMMHAGQFLEINWTQSSDIVDFFRKLEEEGKSASERLAEAEPYVKGFLENKGISSDWLDGNEASIIDGKIFLNFSEDEQTILKEYWHLKDIVAQDPLEITAQLNTDKIEDGLSKESIASLQELVDVVTDAGTGTTWLSFDELKNAAKEAGYTEEGINKLIAALDKYGDKVLDLNVTKEDPLGLVGMIENVDATVNYLKALEIEAQNVNGSLQIDLTSFVTNLKQAGLAVGDIQSYVSALPENVSFTFEGNVITNADETNSKISELYANVDAAPQEEIRVDLSGNAEDCLKSITEYLSGLSDRTITVTVNYKSTGIPPATSGNIDGDDGTGDVNGTAHVQGTAYKSGKWGLQKAEHNSLVGELGQELVVDPKSGKYYTVGDNGAEMVDLPKNAIVFNHKQTKDLLSHGYAVGRGKAYASGTAYAGTAVDEIKKMRQEQIALKQARSTAITLEQLAQEDESKIIGAIYAGDSKINGKLDSSGNKSKSNSSSGNNNDKKDEEGKETFDFIEIKMEEIESLIEKITAKIALFLDDTSDINKKDNYYDQLVEAEKNKASTYLSAAEIYNNKAAELLKEVPEKYRDMAKNGAIAIEDFVGEDEQKTIDAINNYREWAQKADEAEVGYLESVAQAAAYRVEQLDDIATDFENLTNQIETQAGLVQSHIDLIEESGNIISEKFYKDLMKKTKEQRSELVREKQSLQKILDDAVKSGDVTVGTDEWFEMVQAIYDVDDAIVQCDIDLEGYQNSINELSWESFERLVDQLDNIDSELSFISDLMSKNDWEVVDEDANWTDKGITALGMYAQQMEIAQTKSQQYAKEIKELKKLRDKGLVSETEYIEKLAELKDGQMDTINAYEDAKDAIVNLNKVRIEAVKEGLQDELDAYQELIEKKKEALDADKDLYDFEKNVAEQQKEIATIQRKIAALSGDNSLSATAQRRKLEAELLEAQADLEDTYRDRSYDNTIDALDKESEAYEESINNQIEELDKSLENIDAIVTESLATVRANTDTVLAELVDLSKTYGIELSKEITSPWADGEAAISAYSESFKNLKDSFAEELNYLIEQEKILQKEADKAAQSVINSLSKNESTVEGATNPDSSKKDYQSPTQYGGAISADGIVGPNTKKKFKTAGYAKGTLGTKKDELALIDELGEELVMHAGPDGKLMFLSKGSSVIPSNITENLMKIGQLDPTEVLKRSTPSIGAPHITNNNIEVNMQIAEVVHIDEVTNETIPDLTKAVEKQMDKYMKNLNGQIRKYAR